MNPSDPKKSHGKSLKTTFSELTGLLKFKRGSRKFNKFVQADKGSPSFEVHEKFKRNTNKADCKDELGRYKPKHGANDGCGGFKQCGGSYGKNGCGELKSVNEFRLYPGTEYPHSYCRTCENPGLKRARR